MKKSIYMAAALAVLAGCAKTETEQAPVEGVTNLALTVSVKDGADTKAVFDGDSHLKFEKGDYFYGAIAKAEKPKTGIKVASQANGYASNYYTIFNLVDAEAEVPSFRGNFWSIAKADTADVYNFYGVFPAQAVYSSSQDLSRWRINLSGEQTASQSSWDGKVDAMVMKSVEISGEKKVETKYNEYDIADSSSVEFAHLFGFGKLTFADVPEEYASYPVKKVVIEAVGDKKDFCGQFLVDITKEVDGSALEGIYTGSAITVTPSSDVTVADNVVWFVANPGTYDVKITVETPMTDLVFERQGLTVSRSRITSPTVHFKEADAAVSHDVVLNGETWEQTSFSYSTYLASSRRSVEWGPEGKKMVFSLKYPGSSRDNYGTSYYREDYSYVQGFASYDLDGGEVHLASDAAFKGVDMVKVGLGVYTMGASCDFDICLVNKADTTVLKTINIATDSSKLVIKDDYWFINNDSAVKDGVFVVRARHLSSANIRPYLSLLVLNPAPELVLGVDKIKLEKDAASGSFDCNVYASDAVPEVSSDADWLKVSYADGKVTYTAEANEGTGRKATVTIKVNDGNFSVVKTVPVSQKSAVAVEYKLTITAADMYPLLSAEAEKNGNPTSDYDYFDLTFNFKAVATDGSGRTMDVVMNGTKFILSSFSEEEFGMKNVSKFGCADAIGSISKIVVVANNPVSTGYYANLAVKFSKDGENYANGPQANVSSTDSNPYTSTIINEDEDNVYFNLDPSGGWSKVYIRSIEVIFVG